MIENKEYVVLLDNLISVRDIGLLEKINDLMGNVDVNKPPNGNHNFW
jgi:hypothetical protein